MFSNQGLSLPKKTYMRKSLTMHNPTVIKSSDGQVYRRTGKMKELDYVKPKGRVYVAPSNTKPSGGTYESLKPFEEVFASALSKKGFKKPDNISDTVKLFYNNIIAAKGFNGTKPMNFEAIDHADSVTDQNIVSEVLTYLRSLNSGVQPNGTSLSTQDQLLSPKVKEVIQDLAGKASNAGLSPQDAVKAGVHLSNSAPEKPFYKEPLFQTIGIALVAFILIYLFTR
jgi:hypothetical protein